jgi:hypothetical protein
MTKFIGRRGTLGLVKESVRGTGIAVPTFWIPRVTMSFDDKVETARESEGLGKIADSDANYVTARHAEGDVEFQADDRILGLFLTSLIGASPVKSGANPYTYTYTLANTNQHQSISIVYQDPDFTKMFPLGVVDSLKFNVDQSQIVTCTASFKSRFGRNVATQTPDFTVLGSKFLEQHLIFKTAANVGSIAAASAISLKKLEFTISANAMFDNVLGTVEPEDILNQQFAVEGSFELLKQDDTYRNYMLDGTYKALGISFVGDTAANSQLNFQFPRVDFTAWEQDRGLDNIVSQKVNFKANYDAANALDIISTLTLINTLNSTNI